jgi:signal transduction histidine kinase
MPVSFRARLTLSYTILTALLLSAFLCALAVLIVERTVHSTMADVDAFAARTRSIVTAYWFETDEDIVAHVQAQAPLSGVRVTAYRQDPGGPPPGRPPRGERPGPPPDDFGAPPPDQRPPPSRSRLASFIGLRARVIPLHAGEIEVAPDGRLNEMFVLDAYILGLAEIVAVITSWLIGRSITQQAVAPLATVTSELRRFAAGNFAPSMLETADRTELGQLVSAYNGAAAQVVAAFSERERTEHHLRMFLGEAGHEMRTPMTVISAYLDLLDASGTSTSQVSGETLQSARAQMRRLRTLVERVMALARLEGSDQTYGEFVDVVEIAHEAIGSLTAVYGGTVRLTHDAEDVVVRTEPWVLQEAIGNLVDNAIAYGRGLPIDVAITLADGHIVVRVRDHGPGISDEDRDRLFQHFFRGEASAGVRGSGLGLAIVARAARRLGGSVALENAGRPGGATFRLTIPIYQPEQPGEKTVHVG